MYLRFGLTAVLDAGWVKGARRIHRRALIDDMMGVHNTNEIFEVDIPEDYCKSSLRLQYQ